MSEFLRFRGSSKFFLIMMFPIMLLFFVGNLFRLAWTDYEMKVSQILTTITTKLNCKTFIHSFRKFLFQHSCFNKTT